LFLSVRYRRTISNAARQSGQAVAGRSARTIAGLSEANAVRSKLVQLDRETSNALFEVFEDWDHQLQKAEIDFEELSL